VRLVIVGGGPAALAAERTLLEQLPFPVGYGVEIAAAAPGPLWLPRSDDFETRNVVTDERPALAALSQTRPRRE